MELLKTGAAVIQNNDDDATTGLDVDDIANALAGLFGGSNGGIDIGSIVGSLAQNGLGEIVSSWIGSDENMPIDPQQVVALLGSDKVSQFASQLGLSEGSALQALSDALPQIVDQATSSEESIAEQMLEKVGGVEGAMGMLGKMFG